MPTRWEPSGMGWGGSALGVGGFSHQEHAWRSIEPTRRVGKEFGMATRLEWGVGACPTSPPIASGTAGQAEISAKKTVGFRGRHHPGMVGRNYPGMTWACSQKQSPGSCAAPGLLVSRGGLGGLGQRDTRAIHRQPNQHCQIKS
jgi:hypothetical protein